MTLLSVGAKMHDGCRDAVRMPSNLKSVRVGKDREGNVTRIEIEGDRVLHKTLTIFSL